MSLAAPIDVPTWVSQFMSEIDTLVFADGFAHMPATTSMYFGTEHVEGVDAIKAFFDKIDRPLDITHTVLECWQANGTILLRGEAIMAKKTNPEDQVTAPFMHIFYLADDSDMIETLRITAGPLQTDAAL